MFTRGIDYSMYGFFGISGLNTGIVVLRNEEVIARVKDFGFKKVRTLFGVTFAISIFSREV